jgi:hypothetical protein
MKSKKLPAVVTTLKANAHLVRQAALKHELSYSEEAVPEREDLVSFSFGPMDDATTLKLLCDIPREAFAYQAVFLDGPPPECVKSNAG